MSEAIHEYDDWYKFAIVRNPFDRIVSCYKDHVREKWVYNRLKRYGIRKGEPFESYVEKICVVPDQDTNKHYKSQYYSLMHHEGVRMDFIGRFESLAEDVATLGARLKTPLAIPHANATDHPHYSYFYNEKTRALIAQRYACDFQLLGYDKNA